MAEPDGRRFLVTGATGFIGRRLVERLSEAGRDVTAFVRASSAVKGLERVATRIQTGDVATGRGLDEALAGVDVVFHLAGAVRALSLQQYQAANVEGVRQMLAACARQSRPPTVVLVSSLAAAGPSVDGTPRSEEQTPQPVSDYGRSKLGGEAAAREFMDRVPISIVRPPIVFGGGDRFTLSWFRSIDRLHLHPVPGSGASRFSLIHVDDLIAALQLVADRGSRLSGEDPPSSSGAGIFFAACPEFQTYREIGENVAAALGGKRVWMPRIPLPALCAFAAVCEGVARVTRRPAWIGIDKYREARAGSWICDARKVRELGLEFSISPAERFRETVEWYRRMGLL